MEIDHIAIAVENIDEAIRWYGEALGFSLLERRITQGDFTSMLSARVVNGRTTLVLLQGTCPESQISRFVAKYGCGVHHVAFAVGDLDEAIREAEAAGSKVDTPIANGPGIRQVFLERNPANGVRVELLERRGGELNDQNIEHLFRALEKRDLL